MKSRIRTRKKSPTEQTPDFSTAPAQPMFQSRAFVVQQQRKETSQEQSDLKTSLMRAQRYGHHLSQMHPAGSVLQRKTTVIQLAKVGNKVGKAKTPKSTKKKPNLRVDTRRAAAGYENPKHQHSNMRPLYENAAVSPVDTTRPLNDWLYSPSRRFNTYTPTRSQPPIIVKGHSNTVMGHQPDAVTHWNTIGHTQPRASNFQHNRQTTTYHGLEERGRSNASGGATTERYRSPSPSIGSHESYFNVNHSQFNPRNPWPEHFRREDAAGNWENVKKDKTGNWIPRTP